MTKAEMIARIASQTGVEKTAALWKHLWRT